HLSGKIIECGIKEILEHMSKSLVQKKRIEIRGFGSFSLHYRSSRIGRNPKTGKKVQLTEKYVPYFKPGKQLRNRTNVYK
ncbi:integration host factor subunit beta, partial [Buchnera aphidicola]|nr:integration host factor subunit beta [Buchnera aphidicola]